MYRHVQRDTLVRVVHGSWTRLLKGKLLPSSLNTTRLTSNAVKNSVALGLHRTRVTHAFLVIDITHGTKSRHTAGELPFHLCTVPLGGVERIA